ncbi:MAG: GntR family transcriptional regulator [Tannerellaceae bacterium]|jgi:predicted RNA-binding protein (virulence factor B family)|nr:GntR family transcriptional regulator [Tannerellaceae bacterium]
MFETGKYNTLKVVKEVDFGVYLDGGDGKEILLPTRYLPEGIKTGDEVEVFIYHDNEGRLIATTLHPKAIVGEFRLMQVKSINETGAFLDWGLMKDLLVPFNEQKATMREGGWYLVYVRRDNISGRIMASAKIDRYLDNTPPDYQFNQEVELTIDDETSLGYRVIINNLHRGLVYHSEIFRPLHSGDRLKGYIKEVREDEKIDVSLTPLGYKKVDSLSAMILDTLNTNGGYLPVHDKSDPEQIHALFHCSKKAFKQAIGLLYKQQLITLEREGIRSQVLSPP